jgi:uncharacterized membrane protein
MENKPYHAHPEEEHDRENDLTKKILLRIEEREHQVLTAKVAAFAVLLAASVFIVVFGVLDVVNAGTRSGFFAFAGLFFSDFSMVMANFSDFAFSLIESFPIFSTILLLSGVLFAMWSFARLIEEADHRHHRTFSSLH